VIILDTGPIVALLNRRDAFHKWAREELARDRAPYVTCEAVVTEACHLLRHEGCDLVIELGERGFFTTSFVLGSEWRHVRALVKRYADVPMSLADACLVRMSELDSSARVMTLDSDFRMYRRNGRQVIPMIAPTR
jgi:predicted nucleic acid-binding protein